MTRPRVLIEEWLPAAALGVECMRERGSVNALAPHTYLHVWWARRPLTVSRAAVLASLLPADFPRDVFERLVGFGRPSAELVETRRLMDEGYRVPGGFNCERAFKMPLRPEDLAMAHEAAQHLWGTAAGGRKGNHDEAPITVIDPMAGGGSIPLESARLGFATLANEYSPVACTVLEATIDYPFRFGVRLADRTLHWGKIWEERAAARLKKFYPAYRLAKVHAYIFARTVPCPDTQHATPLVPDWHLKKPKGGIAIVAVPAVDMKKGTWKVDVREVGRRAGQVREAPAPTYGDGKGISLFTGRQVPSDYIKAKALAGEMKSALYAVAVKGKGLSFVPPSPEDLAALLAAERELARLRPAWERGNVIPTEMIPVGDKTGEPMAKGIKTWSDLFAPRQLLAMGVLVEELRKLRPEIAAMEGPDLGPAVEQLLAIAIDKLLNYNSVLASWHAPREVMRSVFDRHDFSFKPTFAEMAPCNAGSGLTWAVNNVSSVYEEVCRLVQQTHGGQVSMGQASGRVGAEVAPVVTSQGSATNLPQIADGSITAVVVDPPYADNVQYSELADFFYVWLKRTQGHRRPEWFSTYLTEHDYEAVVNVSRHKVDGGKPKEAKAKAHAFYQELMAEVFRECRRILRDDGVLTVMFTHKKQEAWETLFQSLIAAGFTIHATWPVKTESEHSLHQAKKNAAQSTVILVARKRLPGSGIGYFDAALKEEIRRKAEGAAERLATEGLNPVDQLVGSFGPAMEVFSRYDEVRSDTVRAGKSQQVEVGRAIDEAADAVSAHRIRLLAERGLEGVEAEGRFALLCWDVLQAAEFRFNEAKLLGNAVGMDVDQLAVAGLVSKSGDKIRMLSAKERRRERALEPDEVIETLFGPVTTTKRRTKKEALRVHPNDPRFRTALDACHALALRYLEASGGAAGIGSAKALVRQQNWSRESAVARLMEALVHAAPEALRHEAGRKSAAAQFPEFRAWHALLPPLFGMAAPDWTAKAPPQGLLPFAPAHEEDAEEDEGEDGEGAEE